MLGVGVTLSTLPLYLLSLGATPNQLGITIACFSAAQMVGCPILVGLSSRVGRLNVLRACLSGNAAAALLTASAGGWRGVTLARVLAGLSAASVPVAQVAVSDFMPPGPATSKALSRVASAASLGLVMGPAAGGLFASLARRALGASPLLESRVAFGASGLFAVTVLLLMARVRLTPPPTTPGGSAEAAKGGGSAGAGDSGNAGAVVADREAAPPALEATPPPPRFVQPLLRWTALVCSVSITTGIAIYALFGQRFLGYGQPQLSASQSAAAAAALVSQLWLLPRLIDRMGEARSCACGLGVLGVAFGGFSLVRAQPLHMAIFVLSRAGHAVAEVANAALVASSSTAATRGRNLALLQSFQAGSRLVSPLVASALYTYSTTSANARLGPPGALPFLVVGALALLTAPAPLLVQRAAARGKKGAGAPTDATGRT